MKEISKIVSGCMTWGVWGKKFSRSAYSKLIEQYLELGVSTFDHADIYGDYTTEYEFGKGLKEANVKREDIQLITKCGIQKVSKNRPHNKVKHYQYDKDYIIKSVEQSLKNLHTDYLDILLLHRPSPLMDYQEIAKCIHKLISERKILKFGVSNFTSQQCALLSKDINVEINQIECSLTANSSMTDGTLDDMKLNNITPMAWAPLANIFKVQETSPILEVLKKLEEKYDASVNQLLIAWLLKYPYRIHPVVGTTSLNRMKDIIGSLNLDLDIQDWFLMYETAMGHRVP